MNVEVGRFDRAVGGVRGGSESTVYTLDTAGLRLLAAEGHRAPVRRPWRPSRPFLAHHVAVSEVYVALVVAERAGLAEVLDFATEPASWRHFTTLGGAATLKPDAYARLGIGEYEDRYFVEVDRDTEGPAALARQLAAYAAYYASGREQARGEVFPLVLWVVPGVRRRQELERIVRRQPAGVRPLFRVTEESQLLAVLTEEAP